MCKRKTESVRNSDYFRLLNELRNAIQGASMYNLIEANKRVFAKVDIPDMKPYGDPVNIERVRLYAHALIAQLKDLKGGE